MKKSAIRKISGYKLPDFETSSTSSVDTSKMIKIGEASRLLGISIDTLRRWERKGWLKTYKTPGGTRLYDRTQLQKLNPSLKKGPKEVISPLVRVQAQNQPVIEQIEVVDTFKSIQEPVQTVSINLQSDQSNLSETKKILPEIIEETRYAKAETFSPSGEKIETVYIKFKRTLFSVALLFIITSAFSVPGYLLTNYIINTKTASNIGNALSNLPFSQSAEFTRRLADLFSPGVSQKLFSKYPPGSPPGLMTRKVNKELSPAQLRDLGYLNGGNFSQKNGSVLAESTPSGSYLQINLDTQINGSLSVDTASVSGKLFSDTVNTGFGDNEVYPMDQALLTSSSVSFSSISGGTINLSGASNQITVANTIISTQTNGSGAYTVSIPTLSAAGNFVIDNVSQTLTNKTISGSSNTFSDIPTSALSSSAITINTAGTLTGGGSVSLGGSITITGAASGVTSITGTSNQVIASGSTGDVTLSLPQDIATTSTPTFAGVLLSGSTSGTLTLNAAATTTSYTLTLPADDGTNNYVLTTDGSGSTSWQAVGGGACANCVLTDPSTSQTVTPTSSTAIGLSIAQASGGSVDVFNVTNNAGSTKYFQVNSSGNISVAQTLTLGTGTVGLYTGAGAPSNGLGADGDYYFRNDGTTGNSSIYYKVSSAWISAGGGSLQNAYDVGSTITTTSGNSVAITLADVATPTQFSVTQQDPAGTSAFYLNNNNASGTNTNGILVEQTGAGAITNGINITQTSGTLINGLNFSGTFTNLINSTNFIVSNAGSVTAATNETINGIDISSGSISDVEGYTQSTGTFAFSGGGNFSIDSAGLDLTTGGAVSGVTGYSQTSGAFSATGLSSGSISVTGASLALATVTSGDITATTATGTGLFNVVTGNLKVGNGSPTITQDGEDAYVEGTFEVDGVSTFGGNVGIGTTATTKALTVNGVIRSGLALAVDIDGNNGAGPLVRWTDTTVSDFMTMGSTGGTNNIDTLTRDFRIYSTAATSGIMFKQDSGNVGIGTTTPLALLHVGSGGTPGVASTGDVYIQNDLEVDGVSNLAGAATFGSTTTLNGLTYTWPGSQSSGQVLSTNGSGTLSWTDPDSLTVRWNSIDNPNGNQSLSMSTYTSTWNWATGTSTNNLFNITSDASANGTGSLVNIQTGASSTLLPLRVRAGSSEALTVNASGNVGIGTTGPTRLLDVTKTSTATSGISQDGGYFTYVANPGSITSSGTYYDGLVSSAQSTANGIDQSNTNLRGSTFVSTYAGNSTLGSAVGSVAAIYNTSSGTVTGGTAFQTALNNTGLGTITNARGILVGNITNSGGGTITSLNGVTINNQSGATNNTNLLIGTTTIPTGTVNYSIYNSSTYDNYFAGVLGINDTTPTEAKALVTRSTSTLTAGTSEVGSYNIFTFSPASAPSSTSKFALDSVSAIGGSADTSAVTSYAGYFQVSNSNTDTSGTGANGVGAMGDVYNTSTGKAGSLIAFQGRVNNSSSGTITTSEGLNILAATNSGGGTVTTNYGILVAAQTVGTSDYGVRIDAADTQTLWISGNADNTTAAAGIAFGASRDTNLYRSAANILYTDDAFTSGAASITSFSTTNEFAFLGGSDGNVELSDSSDNFTYVDFKNLAAEDYDGRIGYASASDNMNFYIAGSASPTLQVSATTMTFTGTTLTASSLATITTSATLGMTSTTTLNLGTSATINAAATALNIQADGTPDVNIAGGSSATGCTVANASGDLTCSGNITGTGTVGGWTRNAGSGFLYPSTITDKVGIGTTAPSSLLHINGSQTSGTVFNLSYGSATILSGDLTGLYVDLNSGNVDATNQNLTGVNFKIPTVTDTHTSGTKTLTGMLVNFGSGAGINQNGAGGTLEYIAGDFHMPALTQTAGTLNAYGAKVTTPATITTGGTAYGYYVSATGVGAGTLSGLGISSITGAAGTEYALNVGTGWDAVLRVGSTTIINGSGVTQEAGGGTSESTYTTGDILYASAANTLDKLAIGNTDGYVLKVSGGVPVWGTVTGGSCTNCLISDPSSTQTIAPTGAATQGLSVRQTSTALGGNTQDIFNVTSSDGSTRYFYVDYQGNVSSGSISNTNVTITPTNDSTALTLVGTNVTSAKNQYINTKNSSGTIFDISYGAAQTLAGAIIGQNLDLSTNVTATNQSTSGQVITLPAATNTSGTQNYKGLVITGGALNENGGTATNFYGADITIPALTQTSGTLTAYGIQVDTPSSITTAGTAYGFQVNATGVGAGTLVGMDITNITAGAGTETGLQIGSGWDTNLLFNDTTSIIGLANGGTLSFNDSAGNNLCTITDGGSTGSFACTGNITGPTSGTVGYWTRSSTTLSPATANDIVSIPTTNTSGADLAITNTGVYTGTGIFNLTANSATTGDIFALNATALTSGSAMVLTGPSSVGVIDNFINITSDIGNGAAMLKLNPDFTSTPGTHYGLRIAATDTQSANNADYGAYSLLTLSGNGAKTAFSIRGDVSSSSTTADTLYSSYFRSDVNGAISTGTRAQYGVASVPSNTATNTGGTTNIYSFYGTPSYAAGADVSGSTVNVYGTYVSTTSILNTGGTSNQYGLYAANGTSSTNGTSTKYGLYVEAQSGADNNYGAYIASNTGIGDSDPTEGKLVVYSDHTSSTSNFTAGVYNVTQASSAASSATLIGIYSLYNTAHSSNTISTIRGTDLQTSFNSTMGAQATVGATNMYAIYTSNNVGGTAPVGTVTNAANLYVDSTYFSGASGAADVVFTNKYGINIANQGLDGTAGSGTFAITSAAGIALANTSSATNNTNLLIGTTTIPTGTVNYSIYNSSAYQNYIAGNVGIGGDTTPDAYLEVGDGTDELQVASTGDLTFVDANSGSSITGPAGGSLTLTAPATSLELQVDGSININIAGGSSATGCTVTNSNGNLTCTGNITGSSSGTVGFWSRSSTTLSPATANDIVSIANTTTTGSDLGITNTGVYTGNGVVNLIANSATTGNLLSLTSTGMTTGEVLNIDGTWAPTDASNSEAIDINITNAPTGSANTLRAMDLTVTDSTALANVTYGYRSTITMTGNAAKVGRAVEGNVTSSSTTADSLNAGYFTTTATGNAARTGNITLFGSANSSSTTADNLSALYGVTSATGILTTGTRNNYGIVSQPASTAASTGGTMNIYGAYLNPSSTLSNPGASDTATNNVFGASITTVATTAADCTTNCATNQYGIIINDGTSSTNGTSYKAGLYVSAQTGADVNVGAYFGSNVGINDTTPDAWLDIDAATTSTGAFGLTDTGVHTGTTTSSVAHITANSTTTGTVLHLSATGMTSGTILNTTGTWTPTAGGLVNGVGIAATYNPNTTAGTFRGMTSSITDTSTLASTTSIAGLFFNNSTGNAASKSIYGAQATAWSSSTTADITYGALTSTSLTGVITTGTRTSYGVMGAPASTAASTGGTMNMYAGYFAPSSTLSNPGVTDTATNRTYGIYTSTTLTLASDCAASCTSVQYGAYIDNGTSSTNGTSTKYGMFINNQTGADTNYHLYVNATSTATSGVNQNGGYFNYVVNPGSATSATTYYDNVISTITTSANAIDHTNSVVRGGVFVPTHAGSGTLGNANGVSAALYNTSSGTITTAQGYNSSLSQNSGTITNYYGNYASVNSNAGTITNTYGYYVGDVTTGTQTNQAYGLYVSDASARNYFAGNVGIGTSTPSTFILQVTGSVGPSTDDTYDLGDNTHRWQDLYLGPQTLHIGTSTSDEAIMSYTTASNTLLLDNVASGIINIGTTALAQTITLGNATGATALNLTSGTGSQTFTSSVATGTAFSLVSNAVTTGNALTLSSTATTTGEIMDLTGTWAPTDGSTNEAIDINITHSNTTSADTFYGVDLVMTDATALGNTLYGARSTLTLSGNAAKTGVGQAGIITSSSTTGDNLIGTDGSATGTGNLAAAQARNIWGTRGVATSTATANASDATTTLMGMRAIATTTTHTAGTTNVYGLYTLATGSHNADAGTITDYGVYIDNAAGNTNGTSTRYGLFVAAQTGADANYGAYFGSNVGIGTSTPSVKLQTNITSTNTNTSSTLAADIGLGVYNTDTTAGNVSSIAFGNSFPAGQGQIGVVNVGSGALAGGHLYFGTRPASGGNILERMRIDTNGNVGIGTTAPFDKLANINTNITDQSGTGTTGGSGITWSASAAGYMMGLANTSSASNANGLNIRITGTAATNRILTLDSNGTDRMVVQGDGNVGIGITNPAGLLSIFSSSTSLTGTATTGSGLLGNYSWTPGSATTASGDLFRLHIGPNGTTTGSLFNIVDDTSSIFAVSETAFTTSLPSNFTASGDVSVAYDIQFTNPTASYIKSVAPLTMVAGETFNSSNLTLQTYNSGSVVFDTSTSGTVLVPSAYVGIGTSSPSTFLHIKGQNVSNRGQISLEATDYQLISFYSGATTGTNLEAYQYFDVANSDMVIQNYNNGSFGDLALNSAGGNVGVGTAAPGQKFHVSIGTDGIVARFTDTSGNCDVVPIATALSCASDVRLKKDIKDTHYGLEDVLKLRAVDYKWKTQTSNDNRLGFIAQEVEAIIPELVTTDPNTGYKSLAYGNFSPVLVRAIQELNSRVENALITLGADGTASSNIQADKITITSDVVVGGLVSASNFALDSSKFNMTGALASVPVSPEGKVTVADAVNALDSKLGNIENKQASQSAELAQAKILGEQAVAQAQSLDEKVASTSANLASLSAQIQELLNSTSDSTDSSSLPASPSDGLTPPAELLTASSSATLANLTVSDKLSAVNLSAMDATVSATLKSLGETFLGNTTIAGDISIDGTFSVSEGKSLNAFPTLYVQNSPLAMDIDIFNGKVKIGKTGNVEAEALALGDQSVGTATITAGQTEITIPSTLITATSRVFLTPLSAVSGNLYISQLTNGSGFKVKISQPNLSDVKFNWLIIGEKQ